MSEQSQPVDSDTSRLEMFADAVMAIAITLLILDIEVPEQSGRSLAVALARQWPSYIAYVVSFLTIGIAWINHHHMFRMIRRSNHVFLVLNMLLLMGVATVPWPTALLADHIHDDESRRIATLIYGGMGVAITVMFNVVWRYAAGRGRLVYEQFNQDELRRMSRPYLKGPPIYGIATILAFWNSWVSLALFGLVAIYYLLPSSGPRIERLGSTGRPD